MRKSLSEWRGVAAVGPPYPPELLTALRTDPRAGAQALHRSCLRKNARADHECARLAGLLRFENEAAANGFTRIAGVDEAGRGPLAGPIVAAAVVLAEPIPGLDDSKRLTERRRERLFEALSHGAHGIGIAVIGPESIDRRGIQQSNYAVLFEAATRLDPTPDFLLVDGFSIPGCSIPQQRLVKGDQRSASIAAASIIAKVTRDRIMLELDAQYPEYAFAENKGYGTRDHMAAIRRYGPCPAHRRSFAPLVELPETNDLFAPRREDSPPCV